MNQALISKKLSVPEARQGKPLRTDRSVVGASDGESLLNASLLGFQDVW